MEQQNNKNSNEGINVNKSDVASTIFIRPQQHNIQCV